MALVKLDVARFDRLRAKQRSFTMRLAKHLGVTQQAISIIRNNPAYGARSDGQARIRAVNEWMRREER